MGTEMQADHGIAGHLLHRLPEPLLGIVRGTQLWQVEHGFFDADFCQHGIGVDTGVLHRPVGHAQQHTGVCQIGHARSVSWRIPGPAPHGLAAGASENKGEMYHSTVSTGTKMAGGSKDIRRWRDGQ